MKEAPPPVFADLGYGILDSAMVEVAAYCLEKASPEKQGRQPGVIEGTTQVAWPLLRRPHLPVITKKDETSCGKVPRRTQQ